MMMLPELIITDDITTELKVYAKVNKLGLSHVDFNLVNIITRVSNKLSQELYEYVDETSLHDSITSETLLDENLEIEQSYSIEIFSTDEPIQLLKYSIVATKSKCGIYLVISKNQIVKNINDFGILLYEDIRKRLAKAGILIGLFEIQNNVVLDGLIARIRVHGEIQIDADAKILLLKSIEAVPQIDGFLERIYQHKINLTDNISSKNRGFVIDVQPDELLMIYKKPRIGINGRDCKGEIIIPPLPSEGNKCNKKLGDGIRLDESDDDIKIFSTKSGYFHNGFDKISIENELEIQAITFKKTGSIEADLNSEIQINVKETNYMNDAVDAVGIDTKNINIEGNVGHNAFISAEKIVITGQVHKSSEVKADNVKIHRLKGIATAKTISVDILEQGRIKAKDIEIGIANGGLIIGETVVIDSVNGNTTIFASKSIEVNRISGEDNVFYLDPFSTHNGYEIREKVNKISALEVDINKLIIQKSIYTKQMRNQSEPIKEIRKKMEYLKTKNIELPLSMKMAYKKYKDLALQVKEIQYAEFMKKEEISELKRYLDSISTNISESYMITHNVWSEHNKVVFKITPGNELTYKPKKGERLDSIRVEEYDDQWNMVFDKELKSGFNIL